MDNVWRSLGVQTLDGETISVQRGFNIRIFDITSGQYIMHGIIAKAKRARKIARKMSRKGSHVEIILRRSGCRVTVFHDGIDLKWR